MCGIAGIVYHPQAEFNFDGNGFRQSLTRLTEVRPGSCQPQDCLTLVAELEQAAAALKEFPAISRLYQEIGLRDLLRQAAQQLGDWEETCTRALVAGGANFSSDVVEQWNAIWVRCRDLAWGLEVDALSCVHRMERLLAEQAKLGPRQLFEAWKLAVVLENIGRMEVRGRDSLGISLTVTVSRPDYETFRRSLISDGLDETFQERLGIRDFVNGALLLDETGPSLVFTYKVAQEVGALGDNVNALYAHISADPILWQITDLDSASTDLFSHTRWASNGIISEPNCHPVDEATLTRNGVVKVNPAPHRVTVCLNGDVDNYQELSTRLAAETNRIISSRVSTDSKIIPVLVDHHFRQTQDMREAFCRAVSECEGSIAIVMQNSGEPGRTYLALRGSGQSLFVGLMRGGYVFASELYGVVEQTSHFLRMDGTGEREAGRPETAGQVLVLDLDGRGELAAVGAWSFDGQPMSLTDKDVKTAEITTRDIDRKNFTHYLHKEISESPNSVAQTVRGKFVLDKDGQNYQVRMNLGEAVMPAEILERLRSGAIRRVYWIGQGTAAVAGQAVANMMERLFGSRLSVQALKATELSGYLMTSSMDDALIIAISQSGTTTDTNRTVDMARERGASVVGIVNRRNSDLVYKVQGVLYTSDGRDIEMSVASTKAFYSQVVAGYILTYHMALALEVVSQEEVYYELAELARLPDLMKSVLERQETVRELARKFAPTRRDWAVVGSGSTRSAANEIRIKLAELCYKSIATDHIEDKKHIDLSSEPLTLVCAAGLSLVALKDAVKEIAIFRSHKSIPIVVCSEGFDAFEAYADGVVYVPKASENASLLLNVVVGHLWGYYCALAIDEGAERLRQARATAVEYITGDDESFGSRSLRRIMVQARQFQHDLVQGRFNSSLSVQVASELTSLLGYLGGARSLRQFSEEFQARGTPAGLAATLITVLSKAIHELSRPIDAIKHQAKTITVGISRLEESFDGALFDAIRGVGLAVDAVPYRDAVLLRALTPAVQEVSGTTCYRVEGLGPLGEPEPSSTVTVLRKEGLAAGIVSRADKGYPLVGTKEWAVRSCSLYLGRGSRDRRSIAIVPIVPRGRVEKLVLLHLNFDKELPLDKKVAVMRDFRQRYDDLRSMVTETDLEWRDEFLDWFTVEELLARSIRELSRSILNRLKAPSQA
ncbi:MAG: SIS domain-containing protein [Vulcanimicrobiota bacterium]